MGRGSEDLRRAAGDVLVVGLGGPALSGAEAAWLKRIQPAGIILFRRNLEHPAQALELFQSVEAAAGVPALSPRLRAVDVEGGQVDRLRELVAPMPSPAAVGDTGKPELFENHGRLVGEEVRAFGFNATFAPVLDLRTGDSTTVLKGRTAAADPARVTSYAGWFLDGLAAEGVLGCGKHFPGLGSGNLDSHLATPHIEKSFEELWQQDLVPYRALADRLPLAMVSHACYPHTESGLDPASVSHFWTSTVLQQKIRFGGLVVTDDMEMGGILTQVSIAEAVVAALLAGAHLIEICHEPERILAGFEALISEAERSPAFAERLDIAATHSRSGRHRLLCGSRIPLRENRIPPPPSPEALAELRERILRFAETVHRTPPAPEAASL